MKWADGITEIVYLEEFRPPLQPGNVASVNRRTGRMYVNRKMWDALHPDIRFFIFLHEMGHLVLQSMDEEKVDEWAFKEYAKRGKSLKRVVHALIDVLAFHDPYGNPIWEHYERGNAQLERAKAWDLKLNQ